jgi:hypothetical protein
MRGHTANELLYKAQILAADAATVLAPNVGCGVSDLSGRRLEQAQLVASETTHMILMRAGDAAVLTSSSYVSTGGTLYVVDYTTDPRIPRPGMWLEVYCHVERSGN